ncbi:MAG: HAMP domain-containing sensor histidine kinase [Actinomycetota bacterium]|nr:HAMP domain-containing sensor histidine kinase [Actinomycetota bacterium]
MRRRLAFLSLAVSSLVVIAFLIPLGILVRNQAENRALTRGERFSQSIAASLAVAGSSESGPGVTPDLATVVMDAFGDPEGTSVIFPDGTVVGTPTEISDNIERAQAGAAFTARIVGGAEVLVPVLVADSPTTEDTVVVRTFVSDEELTEGVLIAWAMLGALGVFLIVVAIIAADRLGQSIVRPVTDLSRAAHRLGNGDLETRVDPAGPEEIAEVGEAFNILAGRLGDLLEAERESVADLSHQLRTPLTALRLQAETVADREDADALLADVGRMETAVNSMIEEARGRSSYAQPVSVSDLGEIVTHRAAFWQILADEQGRATSVIVEPGDHLVPAPAHELGALIDVLIENVFAHTPQGTGYQIRVRELGDGGTEFVLEDAGSGFGGLGVVRRGESTSGSTGLGLDIVARTAERYGGSFRIGDARSGGALVGIVFGVAEGGGEEGSSTSYE